MNTQNLSWGLVHLFSKTPAWASKTVSVLLTLTAVYGAFILKYPDVIPAVWQGKIGGAVGMATWFFQAFGITPASTEQAPGQNNISSPKSGI